MARAITVIRRAGRRTNRPRNPAITNQAVLQACWPRSATRPRCPRSRASAYLRDRTGRRRRQRIHAYEAVGPRINDHCAALPRVPRLEAPQRETACTRLSLAVQTMRTSRYRSTVILSASSGSIPVSRTRVLAAQILYLGRLCIRRGKYVEDATIPVPPPVTA